MAMEEPEAWVIGAEADHGVTAVVDHHGVFQGSSGAWLEEFALLHELLHGCLGKIRTQLKGKDYLNY